MVLIHNPFGFNPLEIHEEDSGKRVGRRIREIRTTRGLTQAELGEWFMPFLLWRSNLI